MIQLFSTIGDRRVPLTYRPDLLSRLKHLDFMSERRRRRRLASFAASVTSQCCTVSPAAPIIVCGWTREAMKLAELAKWLKEAGFQAVSVEAIEPPFCDHGAWI